MRTKTLILKPDVADVLRRGRMANEDLFVLPDEQLSRKIYVAVNKALALLGGKWNRGRKGHVVPGGFEGALYEALSAGSIVDKKATLGWFPTPPELADRVVELACVQGQSRVLEPSAGEGELIEALFRLDPIKRPYRYQVTAVEIDKYRAATVRHKFKLMPGISGQRQGAVCVFHGDFLEMSSFATETRNNKDDGLFARIIMNPPFNHGSATKHVMHALQFLASPVKTILAYLPAGVTPFYGDPKLVAILPASAQDDEDFLMALRSKRERYTFEDVPDGSFKASGTNVRTVILVVG